MKLSIKSHKFQDKTLAHVTPAIEWIENLIEVFHIHPTLRQVFYHLVTERLLVNMPLPYKYLGRELNFAKMSGMLDWDAVEDITRYVRSRRRYVGTKDLFESACDRWHMDYWEGQERRPEVWIEKDALLGVIEPVCHEFDVDFYSLRGWGRPSDNMAATQKFAGLFEQGQTSVVLHAGDYDPTGCFATKYVTRSLSEFARNLTGNDEFVSVRRIGLTKQQIRKYSIPSNRLGDEKDAGNVDEDKKDQESRWAGYVSDNDGCEDTWELDALSPEQLQSLVRKEIKSCITNKDAWDERQDLIARLDTKNRTFGTKHGLNRAVVFKK